MPERVCTNGPEILALFSTGQLKFLHVSGRWGGMEAPLKRIFKPCLHHLFCEPFFLTSFYSLLPQVCHLLSCLNLYLHHSNRQKNFLCLVYLANFSTPNVFLTSYSKILFTYLVWTAFFSNFYWSYFLHNSLVSRLLWISGLLWKIYLNYA